MSINSASIKRPPDRSLFLAAAVVFPLLVLIGYFKSYYFSAFFNVPGVNRIVHAHGIVMTLWVVYFTAQIALIRSKNIRLHQQMGIVGIILAMLVVVSGIAAAIDAQLVRQSAPGGIDPHGFFAIPITDMFVFVVFFAGAVFYRKHPAEHKALMLMTAINFLPPALGRIQLLIGDLSILWVYVIPDLIALILFGWHARQHRCPNKIFLAAIVLLIASQALRVYLSSSEIWLNFVAWLVS